MKFLIVPAELEPKELLVYAWLYKHSNQTKEDYKGLKKNEVYTSSRKISDETKVPQSSVVKILVKLEKESYITQVYKSKSSKEPSKYFLTFNESVFESHSESVLESVGESVSESVQSTENTKLESDAKTVSESVSGSVNESHSESVDESKSNNISNNGSINKSNNISKDNMYLEIFNYYLSLNLIKHKDFTPVMKKSIQKAMKDNKYTLDDCKVLLLRHKRVVEATKKNKYPIKIRTLNEFFGQKIQGATSLICTQYEEGGKYYNLAIQSENKGDEKNRNNEQSKYKTGLDESGIGFHF